MPINLVSLVQQCGLVNLGGGVCIDIALIDDIVSFPDDNCLGTNYDYTTPVAFKPGKDWVTITPLEESLGEDEQESSNDQGVTWANSIGLQIASESPTLSSAVNQMVHGLYVVKFKDKNNDTKLFGKPDCPLTLKAKFNTQTKSTGLRAYNLTFSGTCLRKTPFYPL